MVEAAGSGLALSRGQYARAPRAKAKAEQLKNFEHSLVITGFLKLLPCLYFSYFTRMMIEAGTGDHFSC